MTLEPVLSDAIWARIEPLLPPVKGARGQPMRDHRGLVEGAIHRYRTGVAWRDLPAEFGQWQTVWKRHHRFAVDGTWDRVLSALQAQADGDGDLDWRVGVDSTVARVHQHGATAGRPVASSGRSSSKTLSHTGGATE